MAERDHRKRHCPLGIDIDQPVHLCVHESADHLGRHSYSRGDRQQIAYERAIVPAEMPIRACLIFPSVAPVRTGANDRHRGMNYRRLAACSLAQNLPIISRSQFAQCKIRRRKVVHAGFETLKIATNYIELDLVECPGASCGAEVDLAARILPMPRDASG